MVKWSNFQWFCYGCLIVSVVGMALVGSAFFAFFCVWHGIRIVNRKFQRINEYDTSSFTHVFRSD